MKISVMLVSKLESKLTEMRSKLTGEEFTVVADSPGGSAALEAVENTKPDVLLMYLGQSDSDVLNLAERIVANRPRTFVALLAEDLSLDTMRAATSVGVHNIIQMPDTPRELGDFVRTVYNAEKLRLDALSRNQQVAWISRVITVFGAKGGLGKTTIAVNLAVRLAQLHKKVALVDLDLQFGDVHIFLDIEPKDTISELVQDVGNLNIDAVRSYMTVHSSGVHVLCAPKSPEYADVVASERVQSLMSLLRSYYDYVIVDTPSNFSDVTITAIEASSLVLFVTGLDVSILKNSKLSMSILDSLHQKDKVRVIINRAVEINTISIADVQRIVDAPILARIPSDYMTAVSALNRGVPFVLGNPSTKLSQALGDIADVLTSGSDQFDIQLLSPRERKKLLKKYKSREKAEKRPGLFSPKR